MTDLEPVSIDPELLSSKSYRDAPVTMQSLDEVRARYFMENPDAAVWEVVLVNNLSEVPAQEYKVDMSSGNYLMNRSSRIVS